MVRPRGLRRVARRRRAPAATGGNGHPADDAGPRGRQDCRLHRPVPRRLGGPLGGDRLRRPRRRTRQGVRFGGTRRGRQVDAHRRRLPAGLPDGDHGKHSVHPSSRKGGPPPGRDAPPRRTGRGRPARPRGLLLARRRTVTVPLARPTNHLTCRSGLAHAAEADAAVDGNTAVGVHPHKSREQPGCVCHRPHAGTWPKADQPSYRRRRHPNAEFITSVLTGQHQMLETLAPRSHPLTPCLTWSASSVQTSDMPVMKRGSVTVPSGPIADRSTGMWRQAGWTMTAPTYPRTSARVSWAPFPRFAAATLIQATGFSYSWAPPTVQSSRFLKLPGSVPAYSGVQNSTASTPSISRRSSATGSGTWSPSRSGLKAGRSARPPYSAVVTPTGASAAAVTSAAVLPDPALVLPDISKTFMSLLR